MHHRWTSRHGSCRVLSHSADPGSRLEISRSRSVLNAASDCEYSASVTTQVQVVITGEHVLQVFCQPLHRGWELPLAPGPGLFPGLQILVQPLL